MLGMFRWAQAPPAPQHQHVRLVARMLAADFQQELWSAGPNLTSLAVIAIKCMLNLITRTWRHATVTVLDGLCLEAVAAHGGGPEMNSFLISLSGARPEILERCPTERLKFQSLGWAILITSGMATVSMWFALFSAMGVNPIAAVLPALLWGVIIMGIDRWLVTSMPVGGARRWTIAIPRLLMALLLGTLISTPLVLRIFQSEINAQISVIKQQRASAFLAQQQNSQVGQQVTYWRKDVANLQKVIDSGGEVSLNPSTDPQVQSLTKQRITEQTQEQQYYQQWQCQLYGGNGCTVKGNGPLAQASERSYNQAAAQVATLNSEIQQREQQLSATDTASKQARYQQAKSALPGAEQQLSAAQARQNELQQTFDAQNEATNGLLIRLEALDQLSGKGLTLNAARLLLFLLFLVIECLPVTVKLLQQPGNYEKILQSAAERELKDAQRSYRTRPRTGTMAAAPAPTMTIPNPDSLARHAGLHDVWDSPTQEVPWPSTTPVKPLSGQSSPEDSEEHTRLDDVALREMEDIRTGATSAWPNADSDGHGGGIELRYGDDDL
jgi:Domain of unknown function (DUF4407)